MANTPSYTQGVKYIKISKKDANGNDQTNELQNLNDIRVLFDDIISPVDYFIASINEYPSYYLYVVAPTNVTSSVDDEILNYQVSASSNTLDSSTGNVISYSVISNPTNYFTASSGYWTLGNTPNISPLNITCSISFSVTPGFGSSFAGGSIIASLNLHQITNGIDTVLNSSTVGISLNPYPGATAGPYTLSLSSSLYPIENSSYYLSFTPTPNSLNTFTSNCYIYSVNNSQFQVTQSIAPYASPNNNLVVLEPYIDGQFEGSDANVLQNNVDTNQIDALYMEVDYTNGSIIAENKNAILNGTAPRAQIQQWNYTYDSHIRGRYIGKEQNALAINTYSKSGSYITPFGFSGSWPGDTTSPSVNGSVVIEQLDSCIYEINWGGGGYPENSNGGGFSLNNILLVGSNKDDVNVISPDNPLYYDTITKNLPYLSQLLVRQYNPTSNSALTVTSLYPGISLNDAVYWIPSDYSENSAYTGYFYPTGSGSIVNQPLIQLYSTGSGSGGNHNFIPPGTRINGVQQIVRPYYPMDQAMITISSSLSPSNPWFASLYYGSGSIGASGSIPGLGEIASGSSTYQMGYPFEITSIQYDPTVIGPSSQSKAWNIFIKNTNPNLFTNLSSINPIGTNGATNVYQLGLILTNGNNPNTSIVVYIPSPQGAWNQFSGIGTGYITTQYPTETIQQNINYITKKYGNNPNP